MDKIEHLVFAGGLSAGFIEYGIIKQLITSEKLNISNIKSMHGTSIGTWNALFFILNYELSVLDDFLIKRPWNKVCTITPDNIMNIFTKKGIFGKELIFESLVSLFKAKNISETTTMKELFDITNIKFYIYATNLNDMKSEEFSYETTPDMQVIDAIYASCAIPLFLKPLYYNNTLYIDGGLFNEYPLDSCVRKNINSDNTEDINSVLNKILGIHFSFDVIENITSTLDENTDITKYLTCILRGMFYRLNNNAQQHKIKYQINVPIDKNKINSGFDEVALKSEKRIELINMGIEIAKNFIENTEDNENTEGNENQ